MSSGGTKVTKCWYRIIVISTQRHSPIFHSVRRKCQRPLEKRLMQLSNLCTLLVVHAAERIEIVSDLAVSEPQSPLIANWKLMAFPFTIAILFMFQQGLAWKRDATHR